MLIGLSGVCSVLENILKTNYRKLESGRRGRYEQFGVVGEKNVASTASARADVFAIAWIEEDGRAYLDDDLGADELEPDS